MDRVNNMTEGEWLACNDPTKMQEFLDAMQPVPWDKATDRKLRLFACACGRRIWPLLTDERSRRAVETAERFADGLATEKDLEAAWIEAIDANECIGTILYLLGPEMWTVCAVHNAACNAADMHGRLTDACDFESAYNPERAVQCQLLRDIFGCLPFPPAPIHRTWQSARLMTFAQTIYQDRAFDRMPELADALEKAGCSDVEILNHCRGPGPHVRGCWVVDLLLGKS